jgi:hypothetical protein
VKSEAIALQQLPIQGPQFTQIGIFGLKRNHLATLSGTDVVIFLKKVIAKTLDKKLAFCSNYSYFLQKLDHNIGVQESANFFGEKGENRRKYL